MRYLAVYISLAHFRPFKWTQIEVTHRSGL
jgi:hypothetical protein